jgi:hypothetical protein
MSKTGSFYFMMAGTLFLPAVAYLVTTQFKLDKNLQLLIVILALALGGAWSAGIIEKTED